jgi:hypothetical protein
MTYFKLTDSFYGNFATAKHNWEHDKKWTVRIWKEELQPILRYYPSNDL